MQIQFKQLGFNCSCRYVTAEVRLHAKLHGHEVYADADGWYYVQVNGEWNYFATIREASRFIKDLAN